MATPLDKIKSAIIGNPPDPNKTPSRTGVVQAFAEMQLQLEAAQSGAIVKATKSALTSLTSVAYAGIMAWVTNDPVQANNGIYENTGTANAPTWVKRIDIPQFMISAVNVGSGTPNAIQATTDLPISTVSGRSLIGLPIVSTNTDVATVSFNGQSPLSIVTNSNQPATAGSLIAQSFAIGVIYNSQFRLLTDVASQALAAASATLAQNAAAAASSSINPMSFTSVSAVMGATIPTLTTYIRTAGYYNPGDKGGALYKKVSSEPSHAGKIQSFDGAYWEIAENITNPRQFGARIDNIANDQAALQNWLNKGGVGEFLTGDYKIGSTINMTPMDLVFLGLPVIHPTFDEGIPVVLGFAAAGQRLENKLHLGGYIRVFWPDADWTNDRISFYAQNMYDCEWGVSSYQSTVGIQLNGAGNGSAGQGCVHNKIRLGQMWQNQVGVMFTSSDAFGWCNGNILEGGFFFGTATLAEQNAGRQASRAGHIFFESTPYPVNGNHCERQSLEWVGPNFRLARIGGYRNTWKPSYTEADVGTIWFHDFGVENTLYWDTGSTGVFDPDAPDRISIIGATNPKIFAGNTYRKSSVGVPDYTISNNSRAVHVFKNEGTGGGIDVVVANGSGGIRVLNSVGNVLRDIPGAGPEIVNGGVNRISWAATKPTSGGVQGDICFNSQPTVLGSSGSQYTVFGWRCVTVGSWIDMRPFSGT